MKQFITKNELEKILKKAQRLIENKDYFNALVLYEQAKFNLVNSPLGSDQVMKKIQGHIVETSNILGLAFLEQGNTQTALEFLKKAEINARQSGEGLFMTLNNLACLYKQMGKNWVSLGFLQESLALEKKSGLGKNLSELFLNICAVLSQLGRHKEAFQASLNSLVLIQEELLLECLPKALEKSVNKNVSSKGQGPNASRIKVLAVSYFNMAVELEHLGLLEDSFNTYSKTSQFLEILRVEQGVEVGQLLLSVDQAMNSVQNKLLKEKKEQQNKKIKQEKERPKTSLAIDNKFRIKKDSSQRPQTTSYLTQINKPRPKTSILKANMNFNKDQEIKEKKNGVKKLIKNFKDFQKKKQLQEFQDKEESFESISQNEKGSPKIQIHLNKDKNQDDSLSLSDENQEEDVSIVSSVISEESEEISQSQIQHQIQNISRKSSFLQEDPSQATSSDSIEDKQRQIQHSNTIKFEQLQIKNNFYENLSQVEEDEVKSYSEDQSKSSL